MIICSSCTEDRYYESNYDFKNRTWEIEHTAQFSFEIDSIDVPYQLLLNIRNTMDYPFRNLYIKYKLKDSTFLVEDKLMNVQLFESKTGKPFGDRQSEIYSHQIILQDSVFFQKKGTYQIELKQYMREEELEGIVSAGIRLDQLK
jgi:gliding motility-associated lipoprotein GldH